MATYPGMSLSGEIRESISLDDDDLSDVEDEVFIRDGKSGYKFAEDIGVKRPLMAPRRKLHKPDLKSRLKNRASCRSWCKPCCYLFGALLVLTGIIALVVVVVSMFPLPINKIRDWIATKAKTNVTVKLLPCSDLRVTDVWTVNLPKLTSESSIRTVDIDGDGVQDIIFGFGTGENNLLPPDVFCPMFMGVSSPCGGGVMALNGINGNVLWKKYMTQTIFTLFCSVDLNGDNNNDCVAAGKGGLFSAINSKDGSTLWDFANTSNKGPLLMDIYTPNFLPDQDGDSVSDIIAAHTSQEGRNRTGRLILVSGKNGKEIQRIATPNNAETYYIPQLLPQKDGQYQVLFGTGSPSSPGNLTLVSLRELRAGNASFKQIYQDNYKGAFTPSILVDITGDGQLDIVATMFNSTIVAIDGGNFSQIWNVTIKNSETLSMPTPGFFNDDNVTDFLVKYQTGREFPIYYYSQAFIINGKTGKVIYDKAIIDTVGSQMAGLTLTMESYGFDFLLYWMADCKGFEGSQDSYEYLPGSTLKEQSNADLCKLRFNSTKVAKLYALNQCDQPPGLEIYTSDNRSALEYNNTQSPLEQATEYLKKHPEVQMKEAESVEVEPIKSVKYKDGSPFRHKDNNQGLIKDYSKPARNKIVPHTQEKFDPVDYEQSPENWQPKMPYPPNIPAYQNEDMDYNSYPDESDMGMFNQNKMMVNDERKNGNRDTRGNVNRRKNVNDSIYAYKNVRQARGKLMNDLNNVPTDILKDTYFKNLERQLRKSRFEQRDLKSHFDKMKENAEVKRVIEEKKKNLVNVSENLWDLESEKEMEDRKNGYWRGKREANGSVRGITRITSMGVLVDSLDLTKNAVDLVFLTYWSPPRIGPQLLTERDFECIANKIKKALHSKGEFVNSEKSILEETFKKECLAERGINLSMQDDERPSPAKQDFPYFNEIPQLNLGQMTMYRLRIECVCEVRNRWERCAKFTKPSVGGGWTEFMNKIGDGVFDRN